jgi:hypothetical protein
MGYDNERTVVLDLGFRQYETTEEMKEDWMVLGGDPILGEVGPDSTHPRRFMEFTGVTGAVGVRYFLTSFALDPSDVSNAGFETSVWVQMDAGLAGSQVQVSAGGGPTRTFTMPSDGSWVELGHDGIAGGVSSASSSLDVQLVNVVGSGTFRLARIVVRRLQNYAPSDTLDNGIVLPFMTDMDVTHSLTLNWATDVLEDFDGGELRTQHREAPKMTLKADFLCDSEQEAALIESLIFGSAGKSFFIPFWPDTVNAIGAMTAGSSLILIDTTQLTNRLFVPFCAAMLWESPFKYDVAHIHSLGGVHTDRPLQYDWPVGSPIVPLLIGLLSPKAPLTLPTPEMRRFSATFDILPGQVPVYPVVASDIGG